MSYSTTITSQGQVTIPIAIRQLLGLQPADKVSFIEKDNQVIIKPAKDIMSLAGSVSKKVKYSDEIADNKILKYKRNEYHSKSKNS